MDDQGAYKTQLQEKSVEARQLLKEHDVQRQKQEEQKIELDRRFADNVNSNVDVVDKEREAMENCDSKVTEVDSRLGKTVVELRGLVVQGRQDPSLDDNPDLRKAEEALEESSA